VAFFSMPERGHFQRLLPLISGLTNHGIPACVFTDRRFEAEVVAAGGAFVDLFSKYPLDQADDESIPFPCRFVSFAGAFAEQIARDLEALRPGLIVYDTFAVIGHVAARMLGVPYVNVCAGHNMDPARVLPQLEVDPRVAISADCQRAVEALTDRYGLDDASPFSYISGLSPFLNVYCEPPAFLTEAEQRAFDPVVFFGSLPSLEEIERRRQAGGARWFGNDADELKVYVSFGTVVWRYWAAEARDALRAISGSLAQMPGVRAVLVDRGAPTETESARMLRRPSVAVASEVDQWDVLQQADLFVTHQGLNSTHEAIFSRVPMISYPFFSDQPALAEKCRQFGLAIPLSDRPRARLTEDDVRAAVIEFMKHRESMRASLAKARDWELEVIADRGSVLRRIAELIDGRGVRAALR
jgi:MGT family glycosyltransferase